MRNCTALSWFMLVNVGFMEPTAFLIVVFLWRFVEVWVGCSVWCCVVFCEVFNDCG